MKKLAFGLVLFALPVLALAAGTSSCPVYTTPSGVQVDCNGQVLYIPLQVQLQNLATTVQDLSAKIQTATQKTLIPAKPVTFTATLNKACAVKPLSLDKAHRDVCYTWILKQFNASGGFNMSQAWYDYYLLNR